MQRQVGVGAGADDDSNRAVVRAGWVGTGWVGTGWVGAGSVAATGAGGGSEPGQLRTPKKLSTVMRLAAAPSRTTGCRLEDEVTGPPSGRGAGRQTTP